MEGRFHIRAERDPASGATRLVDRDVAAPFHLSRPYPDPHALVVQVVHVSPGALAGDRLSLSAEVGPGASVLLTSPSALRIHPTPGSRAELNQRYTVGDGGWLEVWPEWLIPQRTSTFRQVTAIDLAERAAAYIVETLAPGRVAHGEVFAFNRLVWSTRCRIGGHLALAESLDITAPELAARLAFRDWTSPYVANILIAGANELPVRDLQQQLHIESPDALFGLTRLEDNLHTVKLITPDPLAMRHALHHLRTTLQPHLPNLAADPRKL